MKIITGICGLITLILVLCFALSNPQAASIGLWPLSGELQIPLYVVGLMPLLFGLLVGGLLGWLAGVPHRLRARRLHKELGALNEKIDQLQKSAIIQADHILPKKAFWRR